MKNNRILAAVVIMGVLMVLTGLSRLRTGDEQPRPAVARPVARPVVATRQPTASTATLSTGSGRGNEVSADFTVPSGCGRQELSYEGGPTEDGGGFVNFRVYDDTGFPGDSAVGPVHLDEQSFGAAMWTLKAGTTYSVEITAYGARWSYTLKCR